MGPEAALVKARFARGVRCFAVLIDGQIAGYGWLSTGPEWIGEVQLEIHPGRGEAYVWNCATLTAHRRQGVFRSLLLGIAAAARHAGVKRLWIGSVDIPAERAVGPSGFRPALRFDSFTVGGVHVLRTQAAEGGLAAQGRRVLNNRSNLRITRSERRIH